MEVGKGRRVTMFFDHKVPIIRTPPPTPPVIAEHNDDASLSCSFLLPCTVLLSG